MADNENKDMITIPYFVHEGMMARQDRKFKVVLIALIISIVLNFAISAMWVYYWSQFDISNEEIRVDSSGGGDANYIGRDGTINGKGNSETVHTNKTDDKK